MPLQPVNNNDELLEFTPEACVKYANSLPNPKNITPRTFDLLGWLNALWIKATNGFNHERIAKTLEVLYKNDKKFTASDLHWYTRGTIVRCYKFLPESEINEAVHFSHLDSTKAAIVAPRVKELVEAQLQRQPQEIRRGSVWKKQKEEAKLMAKPAERHEHHYKKRRPLPFLLKDELDPKNMAAVEKFKKVLNVDPEFYLPYIENVQAIAKRLEEKSVDGAVEFFQHLGLTSQLYLLEVIDERYVDAFIKEMRMSYIVMGDKKSKEREPDLPDMTPFQKRCKFFAYVELHKDDSNPVIAARYQKLLKAITPPPKQK